jgi:adenosylhomocysteinase
VVLAVLDATGVHLAGARLVVVGYGRVGHGIATAAAALGARVTVSEVDPVEALAALHDGHDVAPLLDAVVDADVVITASGIGQTLVGEHVAVMPDGAVLAVGGAGWPEVDLGPTLAVGAEVRPHVRPIVTPSGATVRYVAEGHCANTTAGEGNPIEVMDLSLALQLRALDHLASTDLPPGVHDLPAWIDAEVAASQLAAAGVRIDVPSDAQRRAASSW